VQPARRVASADTSDRASPCGYRRSRFLVEFARRVELESREAEVQVPACAAFSTLAIPHANSVVRDTARAAAGFDLVRNGCLRETDFTPDAGRSEAPP